MNAKDMVLEQYSVEPIHWSGALKAIILRFLTRKKLFFSKIFKILDFQKEFLVFFFTKCQCSHLFLIADIFKKYPLVLQAILVVCTPRHLATIDTVFRKKSCNWPRHVTRRGRMGQYSARCTQIYTHTRGIASIPNRDYLTLSLHLYIILHYLYNYTLQGHSVQALLGIWIRPQCTSSVGYLRHFIIFRKIFFLHFYCNIKCLSVILSVQSCKYRLTRHVCIWCSDSKPTYFRAANWAKSKFWNCYNSKHTGRRTL